MIDTHAHLNFQAFKDDFEAVLKRAQDEGVEKIINVGADLNSSQKALEIAQKYDNCYASVGIHPHHVEEQEKGWEGKLKKLAQKSKVVAIGETGLDYHLYRDSGIANPKIQKEFFGKQLNLARELNLPVILHCRSTFTEATVDKDAHDDILGILRAESCKLNAVFHCFSGDQEFLEEVLEMGFYVGFDGNLTFKNAKNLQAVAKIAPLDKILLETDSPFLSPEPLRGLRNEPGNVKIIAEFLAQLKGISFEQICQITTQNAKKLFNKTR